MSSLFNSLVTDEGQGMTEYSLILAILVVAVIGALMIVGPKILGLFSDFNSQVS